MIVSRERRLVGHCDEDFPALVVGHAGREAGDRMSRDGSGQGVDGHGDVGVVKEGALEETVVPDGVEGVGAAGVVDGGEETFG